MTRARAIRPRRLASSIALACLALGARAGAEEPTEAAALFDRGLADMQAGRYDTGCPAIARSDRLEPRPGTVFTLAECESKAGRTASALAGYREYLRRFATLTPALQSKQHGREQICAEQLAALEPLVPKLVVVLPEDAPSGTTVECDGTVLAAGSLGAELPYDPGAHELSVRVPGRPVKIEAITLRPGERTRLLLALGPAMSTTTTEGPTAQGSAASGTAGPLRATGWVVGGLGLAGLVVGAITGGLAAGAKSDVDANCDGPACNADGLDAADRMTGLGNASTGSLVVGGALLACGVVLLLTAGDDEPAAAAVGSAPGVGPAVGQTEQGTPIWGLAGVW